MSLNFEVLIIGGGPAGISAAMTLGRMIRSALIVDDRRPRNAPSLHLNNFPTRDGISPQEWLNLARRDLEKYQSIQSMQGTVVSVERVSDGFQAQLSTADRVFVRKVILADGVKDRIPHIPGFNEVWGKAIFHCPFCHGYEIRGSKIGLVINKDFGLHMLPMIQNLASEVTVFTNGKVSLDQEQRHLLNQNGIPLVEEEIVRLNHVGEVLKSVQLANRNVVEIPYLFYNFEMPFQMKSEIGAQLGCHQNNFGLYEVNELGMTSVPGVFAAGDNMAMAQSVLLSSAAGVKAGAGALSQLLTESAPQLKVNH